MKLHAVFFTALLGLSLLSPAFAMDVTTSQDQLTPEMEQSLQTRDFATSDEVRAGRSAAYTGRGVLRISSIKAHFLLSYNGRK